MSPRFYKTFGMAMLATLAGSLVLAAENNAQREQYGAAVNHERLTNWEQDPGQWMNYGLNYEEQRYSTLNLINHDNVDQLGLLWYADINTSRGQEATPLIVDGALYVSTAWSMVKAFDIRTGQPIWDFDPEIDRAKGADACCDVVNRGVAAWEGKIFVGTIDGRLIALDSRTGEKLWEVITVDQTKPYTITGAPRVVKGKVLIGNGGAEYGVRGYVTAYDANTGEQIWRFYTVPGNPADGFETPELEAAASTWNGEWWRLGGGGTVWDSIVYDPVTDLAYLGVGNGSPWNQTLRSPGGGDNLFLTAIVAVNPDNGSYVWHYQTTPGETWDYTAVQPLMVADLVIKGAPRRVIMQAPKNGFFYVLDAATGEFISANNYVPVNWATHIDPDTGRPVEIFAARYDVTGVSYIVQPGPQGGHNWYPMAYSRDTNLVYIPATEQFMGYVEDREFSSSDRGWNTGVNFAAGSRLVSNSQNVPVRRAYLQAWDPVAQEERWRVPQVVATGASGVLATAGRLVFQGNRAGEFVAYDDVTGERLWSGLTQAGVMAAPATYLVDGAQHIAILVGAPALPDSGPGASVATTLASTNNSRLLVFALGGTASLPTRPATEQLAQDDFVPPPNTASYETVAHGEQVFGRYCSVCHGPAAVSANSATFPDLRFSNRILNADTWSAVVERGELEANGMVSFREVLEPNDAEAIRAYVISRANAEREAAQ